jgi:hypothetical protein
MARGKRSSHSLVTRILSSFSKIRRVVLDWEEQKVAEVLMIFGRNYGR